MSDQEFENYLAIISRFLRLSNDQREAIGEELRDHFESRLAELRSAGHSEKDAVSLALEEFGDAAGLAANFSKVTQDQKRRRIMRYTVASVAVLLSAAFVTMALWPDRHEVPFVGKAVAKTTEKPTNDNTTETMALDRNAETEKKLNTHIKFEFLETPLKDVLDYLADVLKVQFYPCTKQCELAGSDLKTPITINLNLVRGKVALDLVMDQAGLDYMILDGIVIVTSKEAIAAATEMRTYDCRDIFAASDKATAPAELISVITSTIAPTTWTSAQGKGNLATYDGFLVVNNTVKVQSQISSLLEDLGEQLSAALEIVKHSGLTADTAA